MRSKKLTWLFIIISMAILPLSTMLFQRFIPYHNNVKSLTGNITYYLIHELIWIVLILLFNHLVIKQHLAFNLKNGARRAALPFIITMAIILSITRIQLMTTHHHNNLIVFIAVLIMVTLVGFFEESFFRGIIFPQILSTFQKISIRTVYSSVIISSLLFGGTHLLNLSRQSLLTTGIQVIFALSFGCLLCAFYVRSGSLWMPIAIHAVWDFNGIYHTNAISDTAIKSFNFTIVSSILIMLVFFVGWMFILLRPKMLTPRLNWLKQITNRY